MGKSIERGVNMGLFDTIRSEYILPKPEPAMELASFNMNQCEYQTKDLQCVMVDYVIDKDGVLYEIEYDIVDRSRRGDDHWTRIFGMFTKENPRPKATNFTGEIDMYTMIDSPYMGLSLDDFCTARQNTPDVGPHLKHDYWITYRVKFVDGKLMDIKITEYRYEDNEQRLIKHKLAFEKELGINEYDPIKGD